MYITCTLLTWVVQEIVGGWIPVSPIPRAEVSLGKTEPPMPVAAIYDKVLHIDAFYEC